MALLLTEKQTETLALVADAMGKIRLVMRSPDDSEQEETGGTSMGDIFGDRGGQTVAGNGNGNGTGGARAARPASTAGLRARRPPAICLGPPIRLPLALRAGSSPRHQGPQNLDHGGDGGERDETLRSGSSIHRSLRSSRSTSITPPIR